MWAGSPCVITFVWFRAKKRDRETYCMGWVNEIVIPFASQKDTIIVIKTIKTCKL